MATKKVLTDLSFENTSKITNLPAGTAATDAVNVSQLDGVLEGLAWKDETRVATTANINLASAPASIDGVTLAADDRVLVKNQSTVADNGVYVFNGTGVAMTRAADADTAASLRAAVVPVLEGTANADTTYRQTEVITTLGTDDVVFITFGTGSVAASETVAGVAEIATQVETDAGVDDLRFVTPLKLANKPGAKRFQSGTFGDGSATTYTITHNLNTSFPIVAVYEVATGEEVIVEIDVTGVNAFDVIVSAAPASNTLQCVVLG